MSVVRVDLMASAAGAIGTVTWHHLYLVATDSSGKQRYLRAGPECLPLEQLVGRKTQYGDAIEDYEPSPAGPYGAITISFGDYEAGAVDFDPVAANVTLASGEAAARLWEGVQKAAKVLAEEQIPYDPVGKCANWAIIEALGRCNTKAALPPRRWVPGASAMTPTPLEHEAATRRVGEAVVIAQTQRTSI
jgi:hypothetical protein